MMQINVGDIIQARMNGRWEEFVTISGELDSQNAMRLVLAGMGRYRIIRRGRETVIVLE